MEVERTWMHGDHLIFKFKGVDTISDAERLAGADVSIPIEQRAAVPKASIINPTWSAARCSTPTAGCSAP